MANSSSFPTWVNKVSRTKRKKSVSCKQTICVEHSTKFAPDTDTFHEFRSQVFRATTTLASALVKRDFPEAEKRSILSNFFDRLYDLGPQLWNEVCAEAKREFERSDRVVDLDVGAVTYQLRSPLKALIAPSADHAWEFSLDHFAPRFVGKGASIAAAHRDFLNKVHSSFQSLARLRPFQMNETQSADWKLLEKLIDVNAYWDSVPVTLLEIGVVSAITADGREIVWLDGERRELIPIERTPPEFAAFEEGQWFEALVERQPKTYQLQTLRYVRQIEPIREMSDDEFRQWVHSLPPGDDVPKSGTEWATL